MEIEQVFDGTIDLPKSQYTFTLRATFWQTFFAVLSVLFVAIDTAINDIIDRIIASISHNIKRKMENLTMTIGGLLCPRMAYA
jgi:hypothetical protein